MRKNGFKLIVLVFLVQLGLPCVTRPAAAQAEKAPYPARAPVDQYLIADENTEIALARSAAPASIADGAEVMVLEGTNGFLCVVERSWGAATDAPEFWNPKIRSPICFNPQAARTF